VNVFVRNCTLSRIAERADNRALTDSGRTGLKNSIFIRPVLGIVEGNISSLRDFAKTPVIETAQLGNAIVFPGIRLTGTLGEGFLEGGFAIFYFLPLVGPR